MTEDKNFDPAIDRRGKELDEIQQNFNLTVDESLSFLGCMDEHLDSLRFLRQYDQIQDGSVSISQETEVIPYVLEIDKVNRLIKCLKEHISGAGENVRLFGAERNGGVEKIIGNVYQGFDKQDVYPSLESKAAHLLYFLVKDHLFIDGNKRIAAFLFIWFLDMNGMLRRESTAAPVVPYGLVYKITVFIAESKPADKETIMEFIISILSFHNEMLLDVPPD